jgi:ethanolaminephosphotransferase
MDGKQARKTGNSSPLGLLFDHGCDSFTTAILSMMVIKVCQVGNNNLVLLALSGATMGFYFCTLLEYYTGGLFLGIGNPVTDGSIVIIAFFLGAGYYGNEGFKTAV